jgi:hypothetical protein
MLLLDNVLLMNMLLKIIFHLKKKVYKSNIFLYFENQKTIVLIISFFLRAISKIGKYRRKMMRKESYFLRLRRTKSHINDFTVLTLIGNIE